MTDRKFTPPTKFPAEYVDGRGERITLLAKGMGLYSLIGQPHRGHGYIPFTRDGRVNYADIDPQPNDLHDLPKRIVRWHNIYPYGCKSCGYLSRDQADAFTNSNRICVHRVEYNEDGSNPEIFVEDV